MTSAERDRSRALRGALAEATAGSRELADGYAFSLRGAVVPAAGEWIALERRCCPFLSFDLHWLAGDDLAVLTLTGPEGTKAFLAAELPELGRGQ